VPADPPVADETPTQEEIDAERLHYEIDLNLMHTLDDCERYLKKMMRDGFAAMEEGEAVAPAILPAGLSAAKPDGTSAQAGLPVPPTTPPAEEQAGSPAPCGAGLAGKSATRVPGIPEPSEPRSAPNPAKPRKVKNANADMPPRSDDNTPSGQKAIIQAQALMEVHKANRAAAEGEREASASDAGASAPAAQPRPEGRGECQRAGEDAGEEGGQTPISPEGAAKPRTSRRAKTGSDPLSRGQRINLGFMAVKLLPKIAEQRADVAHKITERAGKLNIRDKFMQNRAIAVVYGLLLYLDEEWKKLGFGAWMPFRWPDQWLSFCGLLNRVLAANGLIYARNAETYRKLLDETPPVHLEGTVYERARQAKEARTPNNISRCKINQGAYTMSELQKRHANEIVKPAKEHEQYFDEAFRKYGHIVEPPP